MSQLQDDWQPHEDDNGNVYYYNTITGESSWTIPVTSSPQKRNNNYYREGAEEKLDYVNAMYGYDDISGNDSGRDKQSLSSSNSNYTPTRGGKAIPPSRDAHGSPYKKDDHKQQQQYNQNQDANASGLHSPALRSSAKLKQEEEQRRYGNNNNYYNNNSNSNTDGREVSSHAAANAQAHSAFGGGRSSINELLESDADRQLRKIELLKQGPGSKMMRESGRWQEWEAANGAIFYSCLVTNPNTKELEQPFGGQWNKPRVFEIADDEVKHKNEFSSATHTVNDRKVMNARVVRQHEVKSLCKFIIFYSTYTMKH